MKRFVAEASTKQVVFISETEDSRLEFVSYDTFPMVQIGFRKKPGQDRKTSDVNLHDFISVKGLKAQGNRLANQPVTTIKALESLPEPEPPAPEVEEGAEEGVEGAAAGAEGAAPETKPIEPVPDDGPIEIDLDVNPSKPTGPAVKEVDEDPDQLGVFEGK